MTTHTPEWKTTRIAVKQSNFGPYKTVISRGEGRTLEVIGITGANKEAVLKIANNAAAASVMLGALEDAKMYLENWAVGGVVRVTVLHRINNAIALAKGESL